MSDQTTKHSSLWVSLRQRTYLEWGEIQVLRVLAGSLHKKIKLQFFMTSLESPFTENLVQPSLISVEYVMENGTGRGPERCGHHLA